MPTVREEEVERNNIKSMQKKENVTVNKLPDPNIDETLLEETFRSKNLTTEEHELDTGKTEGDVDDNDDGDDLEEFRIATFGRSTFGTSILEDETTVKEGILLRSGDNILSAAKSTSLITALSSELNWPLDSNHCDDEQQLEKCPFFVNEFCENCFAMRINSQYLNEKNATLADSYEGQKTNEKEQMITGKAQCMPSFSIENSASYSLREAMLAQFTDTKNCFMNSLQNLRESFDEKLCSLERILTSQSKGNTNGKMSKLLEHMATDEKSTVEDRLKMAKELQEYIAILEGQCENVNFVVQSEVHELGDKIKALQETVEKFLTDLKASLNSWRKIEEDKVQEVERTNLKSTKKELKNLKKKQDELKLTLEQNQELRWEMQKTAGCLQKANEDLRSENASMQKILQFECENAVRAFRIIESISARMNNLMDDNAALKDKLIILEEKNKTLQEKLNSEPCEYNAIEQWKEMVTFLKKENTRLEKACNNADQEVGLLKQQMFNLIHTNDKVQIKKLSENEGTISRGPD